MIDGQHTSSDASLEDLSELQQQRALVADLLAVFAGTISECAQLTAVSAADGSRHIVYTLSDACKCCSAFVQDTAAKCVHAGNGRREAIPLVIHVKTSAVLYHVDSCSQMLHTCRMLPIGECVVLMKAYIQTRAVAAFGVVCNAFSEALRKVIDDWELFLCSLEHNLRGSDAPVHALWCHVQSSLPLLHFSACAYPCSLDTWLLVPPDL